MDTDIKKICQNCGRFFQWRKKWEKDWDQIKYCSQECKNQRGQPYLKYSPLILDLLKKREASKSICPSEVLPLELKKNKTHMEEVRRAARLLAHEGQIVITQKGQKVDPSDFKGPIRLKKK